MPSVLGFPRRCHAREGHLLRDKLTFEVGVLSDFLVSYAPIIEELSDDAMKLPGEGQANLGAMVFEELHRLALDHGLDVAHLSVEVAL